MPRALVAAACGLTLAATLGGCSLFQHQASIPKGAAVVVISHMTFQPATVEVRAGQPVVWKFDDEGVVHDVLGLSGPNDAAARYTSPQQENGTWEHTFTAPGTYRYECGLHTYMRGEVIVEAN